jgi:DNA-binding beta-propeller fold protein YncE
MWLSGSTSGITIASTVSWIYPMALTLDSAGNVYVGDSFRIVKWNPTAQTATIIVSGYGNSSNQLSSVYALALTPNNTNLFAADLGNNRVQKFSLTNNCISKFSATRFRDLLAHIQFISKKFFCQQKICS